jgi:membrane protease YdiL (CAAX protease family)
VHTGRVLADDPVDPDLLARLHEHGGDLREAWPARRAVTAVVVFVVVDVLAVVGGRLADEPVVQLAVTAAVLYGGLVAAAVAFHRQDGTTAFVESYGLRIRWSDVPWGFVASIAARILSAAVLLLLWLVAPRLVGSNVPDGEGVDGTAALVVVTIAAVVLAPLVEELYFRGFVQRSLETRYPAWLAIAVSSLLFGLAHVGFEPGWGSVGTVLGTGVGGAVFGVAARETRSLGVPIVGHALFNGVLVALVWAAR